jgi:hypothetical protein
MRERSESAIDWPIVSRLHGFSGAVIESIHCGIVCTCPLMNQKMTLLIFFVAKHSLYPLSCSSYNELCFLSFWLLRYCFPYR